MSQSNDNIKLFSYSIAGGNTCWLQSALVVIQGEQVYGKAIKDYNDIYGRNINSTDNEEKFEAKLMQSIHNFLNDKTDNNIAEISKSYQNYVKFQNKDTTIHNQQDVDHSFGGTYDATTFLGHIEEILKGQVGQNFQENRLVLNNGEIVESPNNLGNCEYILSYTPGHWVAYRKEGDKYVEYNTSSPNQRNKYTLDEIINKYKNTIPQYYSNYTPSKTSFHDFNYTPYYNYKKNTYDINKYSPKNPYIPKLPDIPPLRYQPYYYPRQNINYYQQYYYPYRNSYQYQYKPLTNFPLLSIRCGWLFNLNTIPSISQPQFSYH